MMKMAIMGGGGEGHGDGRSQVGVVLPEAEYDRDAMRHPQLSRLLQAARV
jgi:hypothetical protein